MEPYLLYLTVFIGLVTLALVGQAILLFFTYRRVSRLADELEQTVARLSEQTARIMTHVDDLMTDVRQHVERYGQTGSEISTRVQQTVNGLLGSVDRIGDLALNSAHTVMREARAAIQSVVSALAYLGRRQEPKRLPPLDRESLH